MAAFARMTLPQVVWIEGARHLVEPATVRQALEVRVSIEALVDADDDELAHLRGDLIEVLTGWLPPPVVTALSRRTLPDLARIVLAILEEPTPPPPSWLLKELGGEKDGDAEGDKGSRPPPALEVLLADYVQVYGGSVWEVYTQVPWGFFLSFLYHRRTAIARELLRWSEIEILPHTGKGAKDMVADLERRANQREGGEDDDALYAPPERIEKDRAELRKRFGPRSARNTEDADVDDGGDHG